MGRNTRVQNGGNGGFLSFFLVNTLFIISDTVLFYNSATNKKCPVGTSFIRAVWYRVGRCNQGVPCTRVSWREQARSTKFEPYE